MNGRKTEIADMIRSAGLIQQNIPVGPPDGPLIKIIDHGLPVSFSIGPTLVVFGIEPFNTSLGK